MTEKVTAADVSEAVNVANRAQMIEDAARGIPVALGRAIERRKAADAQVERLQAAIAQEARDDAPLIDTRPPARRRPFQEGA